MVHDSMFGLFHFATVIHVSASVLSTSQTVSIRAAVTASQARLPSQSSISSAASATITGLTNETALVLFYLYSVIISNLTFCGCVNHVDGNVRVIQRVNNMFCLDLRALFHTTITTRCQLARRERHKLLAFVLLSRSLKLVCIRRLGSVSRLLH